MLDYLSRIVLIAVVVIVAKDYMDGRRSQKALVQVEAAEAERNATMARLAQNYYEKFKEIENRPAPAAPERVFVQADCVPPAGDTGLGDGTHPGRVELSRGVVGSVNEIAERYQKKLEQCSLKLDYLQQAVRP